jgi:Leucine-rich repeat (LRR) protein
MTLRNLRVLDLGKNKIQFLPMDFSKLRNLEELYLDEEENFDLSKILRY